MKRYIFAGLMVFLVVLIWTFPARVAYNWFAPPDVNLSGISGSIWSGTATQGLAAGAYIQNLSWKTKPLSLFSGKLAFDISAQPAAGQVHATVAVALDGTLNLTNLTGALPLNLVHDALQQSGIRGDVKLDFQTLILQDGLPVVVEGNVTVENFFVPDLSPTMLGDYRADFHTENNSVTASVDDLSGVLDVSGVITLSPEGSYSLVGEVGARPNAPPSVTQQLQFLGSPDESGLRPFRFEGTL